MIGNELNIGDMYYTGNAEMEVVDIIDEETFVYNKYESSNAFNHNSVKISFGLITNMDNFKAWKLKKRLENDFGPLCIQAVFNKDSVKIEDFR